MSAALVPWSSTQGLTPLFDMFVKLMLCFFFLLDHLFWESLVPSFCRFTSLSNISFSSHKNWNQKAAEKEPQLVRRKSYLEGFATYQQIISCIQSGIQDLASFISEIFEPMGLIVEMGCDQLVENLIWINFLGLNVSCSLCFVWKIKLLFLMLKVLNWWYLVRYD